MGKERERGEGRERPIERGEKKWIMRRIEKCWSRWNSRLLSSISPLFSFFRSSKTKIRVGREEEENEKKARAMICSDPVTRFSSFRWIDRGDLTAIGYTPRQNLTPPSPPPSRFNMDRMELANKPREHVPLGFSS